MRRPMKQRRMRRISDAWYELVSSSGKFVAGIRRLGRDSWHVYYRMSLGEPRPFADAPDEYHPTRAAGVASVTKQLAVLEGSAHA